MRQPDRSNPAKQKVSRVTPISSPVGGWNAKDSIAEMKPNDAYRLINWFVEASKVRHRYGSAGHVTGIGGGTPVAAETLAVYKPPAGAAKMFGWAGTAAYDVSSAGAVGAAVLTSLTNARWQTVNATTTGGNFLIAVNGADKVQLYNGTTWTAIDGASTPAITNVTTTTLIHINVHQNRVWYIQKDTLDAWYTGVGAITGALTKFPLGTYFSKGGYLMAMATWTIDGGEGSNDRAVFITSEGEVAVYAGTDPASSSTWVQLGVYQVGEPIGRRCFIKLGADLLILTTDGVISASQYLVTGRTDKSVALTDRIQTAMAEAVQLYDNNFGWELTLFPNGSALFLNVPVTGTNVQFVMNTITRRWCQFSAWDAACFAVFNDDLYFGALGVVDKAWTGTSDKGVAIESDLVQAFNYFSARGLEKHFLEAQPILGWDVNPAQVRIGMDVDFKVTTPNGQIQPPAAGTALIWDTGRWDVNTWGGAIELQKSWYATPGIGYAGALHMQVSSAAATIEYSSANIRWEPASG